MPEKIIAVLEAQNWLPFYQEALTKAGFSTITKWGDFFKTAWQEWDNASPQQSLVEF